MNLDGPIDQRGAAAAMQSQSIELDLVLAVALLIAEALRNIGSEETAAAVRQKVAALTERFPLYTWKLSSA